MSDQIKPAFIMIPSNKSRLSHWHVMSE